MQFKGDTGALRAALLVTGFLPEAGDPIYSDSHKRGTRRIKLWFADEVFRAPQEQQQALEKELIQRLGNRIQSMYFIDGFLPWVPFKSLCIQLKG